MRNQQKSALTLTILAIVFLGLGVLFLSGVWGKPPERYPIPLVDPSFAQTGTVRHSYGDLLRAGEDLTAFDCYLCHTEGEPPPLRFDEDHKLIIPDEHSDIEMRHGQHDRNNNCFNCHNELNLLKLQTRDGRELGFEESPLLCGSCHGPTYRDWEAGAHGRTGGFWDPALGEVERQACVSCHDPHSPDFPPRKPAPGPHPLHPVNPSPSGEPPPDH